MDRDCDGDGHGSGEGEGMRRWGFMVRDSEMEDVLRHYETGRYELVRCENWLEEPGEGEEGKEGGLGG